MGITYVTWSLGSTCMRYKIIKVFTVFIIFALILLAFIRTQGTFSDTNTAAESHFSAIKKEGKADHEVRGLIQKTGFDVLFVPLSDPSKTINLEYVKGLKVYFSGKAAGIITSAYRNQWVGELFHIPVNVEWFDQSLLKGQEDNINGIACIEPPVLFMCKDSQGIPKNINRILLGAFTKSIEATTLNLELEAACGIAISNFDKASRIQVKQLLPRIALYGPIDKRHTRFAVAGLYDVLAEVRGVLKVKSFAWTKSSEWDIRKTSVKQGIVKDGYLIPNQEVWVEGPIATVSVIAVNDTITGQMDILWHNSTKSAYDGLYFPLEYWDYDRDGISEILMENNMVSNSEYRLFSIKLKKILPDKGGVGHH